MRQAFGCLAIVSNETSRVTSCLPLLILFGCSSQPSSSKTSVPPEERPTASTKTNSPPEITVTPVDVERDNYQTHEIVVKELTKLANDLGEALESVKDKDSARVAARKMHVILDDIVERSAKLEA